jgi:hypothetical protein
LKKTKAPAPARKRKRTDTSASNVEKTRRKRRGARGRTSGKSLTAKQVTAAEVRALRRELDRRLGQTAARWNPDPDEVQRSVAQLVLTIVEFLRRLMERQAIRRMEQNTLSPKQVEAVGVALMRLEETVREIGARFGLAPDDLNLDLGPIGKLM